MKPCFKQVMWVFVVVGCATPLPPPPIIDLTADPVVKEVDRDPEERLNAFLELIKEDEYKADLMSDVRHILEAEVAEAKGDQKSALDHWFLAAKENPYITAQQSFEHWLQLYVDTLGDRPKASTLAKLVLSELSGGSGNVHLRQSGLVNEDKMAEEMHRLVGTKVMSEPDVIAALSSEDLEKFDPANPDLLMMNELTSEYCGASGSRRAQILSAGAKLSLPWKLYWDALVHECSKRPALAEENFEKILTKHKKNAPAAMLWFSSTKRIATLRALDRRAGASDEYRRLVDVWKLPGVSAKTLGMKPHEFSLNHVNDLLWAARYRALTGHYIDAETFARDALRMIGQASLRMQGSDRRKLFTYKAEAYHVLSTRVFVELGKLDSAIAHASLGLDIPGLTKEWQRRFMWYLGLFNYVGGDREAAVRHWQSLLKISEDDGSRSRVYFWLARAFKDLGKVDEFNFYYSALVEEYPVSYYSIVAPELAEFPNPTRWTEPFLKTPGEKLRLMDQERFSLENLRNDRDVANLLLRAEIVAAAGLKDRMARDVVRELSGKVRRTYRFSEKSLPMFVYVSRLEFAVQRYIHSISLTTEMSSLSASFWTEWPDQLPVYFPRPYFDIYEQKAKDSHIEPEVLMAISRQETSFRAAAKSGAGAIGLMQLIPPTARRMAEQVGLDTLGIEAKLVDPELNITLGAVYLGILDRYYKGFEPAQYAAYNAGQFAVDRWLARRQYADRLVWVELIPYGETKGYVLNVMRNVAVYHYLDQNKAHWSSFLGGGGPDLTFAK